jgi:hypothetical protein
MTTGLVQYSADAIAPQAAGGPWTTEPASVEAIRMPICDWATAAGTGAIKTRSGWLGLLGYPEQTRTCISIKITVHESKLQRTYGKTIIEAALIRALAAKCRWTTTAQQVLLLWDDDDIQPDVAPRRRRGTLQTTAQMFLEKVRLASGLTLEEIAPLVLVSRRTLQNWRAQSQISARKEKRLRDLAEFLNLISPGHSDEMRRKLLDRSPGNVRPYDLIAEGRFDTAYQVMTGTPAPEHLVALSARAPAAPPFVPVLIGMSSTSDGPQLPSGQVDLRRSRRLKR